MAGRLKPPLLIVLIGLPGAGKSTLARALARERGTLHLDRDAIRARRFPRARFTEDEKLAANAEAWRRARVALLRRREVIVDGMTFARRAPRAQARRLARACGTRCVEIFLQCPVELAIERVRRSPDHPAGDRDAALVREVARRFDPVSRSAVRLDGRRRPRALLRRALAALR